MDLIQIEGGAGLQGSIETGGSKNASLPLVFSSLLASGRHLFHNVPRVKDIETACLLLQKLDCKTSWVSKNSLSIEVPEKLKQVKAPYHLMRTMRAGVLCLGPLLTRAGRAQVSLPGGCAIGMRPVHLHIENLKKMGAKIKIQRGYIHGQTKCPLKGALIQFENSTVGGTQNLMMAAALAEGKTILEKAAREPEVKDLADYLKKMGAEISGAGCDKIEIKGVRALKPAEHRVIPDRIEAATLLIAGVISGGFVRAAGCDPSHLKEVLSSLKAAGVLIKEGRDFIEARSPKKLSAVSLSTAPYPGFPTDLQAQFTALMSQAQGESFIEENIFENRFMHVPELARLNADMKIEKNKVCVKGPRNLIGAEVTATDLRASSCLILAGLAAKGRTCIRRVYHLDRGYEKLDEKLASLGAHIKRLSL